LASTAGASGEAEPAPSTFRRPGPVQGSLFDMTIRHPWRGLEGLPRQVWTLCIATFINRSGTMVLPSCLVPDAEPRLAASRAGVALTVFGIGVRCSASRWPAGSPIGSAAPRLLKTSLCVSALLLPRHRDVARPMSRSSGGVFVWRS
jgi:hypothetical protein